MQPKVAFLDSLICVASNLRCSRLPSQFVSSCLLALSSCFVRSRARYVRLCLCVFSLFAVNLFICICSISGYA